jgi:5'-nucleotidase
VVALLDHYLREAAPLAQRPIARIAAPFDRQADPGGDHALGRLIADAQLEATRRHGAVAALMNPGGIRADLRASGPDGQVLYADLFAVQPFGNTLVTLTLTGAQVRALLESQWRNGRPRTALLQPSHSLTYAWREDRPAGQRVDPDSLRIEGQRVKPDARYRITVNSFLAQGGDGARVLRDGRDRSGGGLDVDALTDYLKRRAADVAVAPDRSPRIRKL